MTENEIGHASIAVTTAMAAIDDELAKQAAGRSQISNPAQLTEIRGQLDAILRQLESGDLPPQRVRLRGLGRTITDSWPLNSNLGALILQAEQSYLRIA